MTRREFSGVCGTSLAALLATWKASADDGGSYPIRRRKKVEKLYQSPDGNPNGLEATAEGLWVGEQITDRAYLLDWETGRPLTKYETQSSNTSGIAAGGGFVFMGANGPAHLRPKRLHDVSKGRPHRQVGRGNGQARQQLPDPERRRPPWVAVGQGLALDHAIRTAEGRSGRRGSEHLSRLRPAAQQAARAGVDGRAYLVHVLQRLPRLEVRHSDRSGDRGRATREVRSGSARNDLVGGCLVLLRCRYRARAQGQHQRPCRVDLPHPSVGG